MKPQMYVKWKSVKSYSSVPKELLMTECKWSLYR